jgi:hypothetical protein
MIYTVNFFIRNIKDELVNFGQKEVNKFVKVVNEHAHSNCGFILTPNQTFNVKSGTFDPTDGSISLTLNSNIDDKYLVASVLDVIPFCPATNQKVLNIFKKATGQKIMFDSDVPTKSK